MDLVKRQRLIQAGEAAQGGKALLEWVDKTRRRNAHDVAVHLFLKKVIQDEVKRPAVQWALRRSGDSQSLVIFQGMATLDQARPPHWG